MENKYEALFTPMKIGSVTVKNRIVLCPMGGTSPFPEFGSKFKHELHDYYIERAKANVGLIIPGITLVRSMIGNQPLYKQEKMFLGPMKDLMDEIHSYGAKLFLQLGAGFGRVLMMLPMFQKIINNPFLKTSLGLVGFKMDDLLTAASDDMPNVWVPEIKHRALTKTEIKDIIDAYIKASVLCKKAGIDGIEIHAIHEGYLLDQFTIANTNKRTDEYGGSLENRLRFVTEIIKGIKSACGSDYPVIVRYSVTSKMRGFNMGALPGEVYKEFGRDREESIATARLLEAAGADALDADNGSYDSWFWAHPPVYMPLSCNLDDAAFIKQYVKIPVFCAGRMENPDTAVEAIKNKKVDGIGIARQLLTDGQWCDKVREGKVDDIRPCIACQNGCFSMSHFKGMPVGFNLKQGLAHCALNPQTLNEQKYKIVLAKKKKKIAVIGGGIGGMEAARLCAMRGHSVTLYEKSNELGGVFIAAAAPEFKVKDKILINWYKRQISNLPITVHMNTEITPNEMQKLDADEIIIATGAKPLNLKIPGINRDEVIEACEYLRGRKQVSKNIVIVGGGLTGCEIAYDLALKGKKPSIVEMQDDLLKVIGLSAANSSYLREVIRYYNIPVYIESKLKEINDNGVVIKTTSGEQTIPADNVIMSVGYVPGTPLVKKSSKHIHIIGDAEKVGNLFSVIWNAYDIALKI